MSLRARIHAGRRSGRRHEDRRAEDGQSARQISLGGMLIAAERAVERGISAHAADAARSLALIEAADDRSEDDDRTALDRCEHSA